jgi:hypothetical protein
MKENVGDMEILEKVVEVEETCKSSIVEKVAVAEEEYVVFVVAVFLVGMTIEVAMFVITAVEM